MTTPTNELSREKATTDSAIRRLLPVAGVAIAAALAFVTIVFFIADAATDNLLVTPPGGDTAEELGLGTVLFTAVAGGIVGTALALSIGRFAPRPRTTFVVVSIVGLALYGIVPFTAAEETATGVWLNFMHISVALPIVGGLARRLPNRRS